MTNNVGILIAAGLVYWFSTPLPDIIIGLIIAVIVMRSAWGVIREAKSTLNTDLE